MLCIKQNIIRTIKFLYTRTLSVIYKVYYGILELFNYRSIVISSYIPYRGYYRLFNNNLGDDLSIVIAKLISKKCVIPIQYSLLAKLGLKKNYSCIGSIIPWGIKTNSIIWGSGIGVTSFSLKNFSGTVIAVRGPITRKYLLSQGIDCPPIYGDPALLLPRYYNPIKRKKFKIGVILHANDRIQSNYELLNKYSGKDLKIIDLLNYKKWQNFIDYICECELIISSSLHGCILSDAYNIPNLWTEFTYEVEENGLKFRDYYLSVNKPIDRPIFKFQSYIPINELLNLKLKWTPISINTDLLLRSCPFNK